MTTLADKLKALAKDATPGPWAYRPDQYDDWGVVKSPPHRPEGFEYDLRCVLAQFRNPDALEDEVLNRHRAAKTDPWAGNARLVVELVNNLTTILRALRERDQAVEALRVIDALDGEINPSNYDHEDACYLNRQFCYAGTVAHTTLASIEGTGHE